MTAKRMSAVVLLAMGVLTAPAALGHPATERYIPIGKSPGLSGKLTYMGKVGSVDARGRSVSGESWSAAVTERTRIWLDRSKLRETNTVGSLDDLKAGRLVEVKYLGREAGQRRGAAEWIKVEIPAPASR